MPISLPRQLGVQTVRLALTLFGLGILRIMIIRLPFVQEMMIPELPIPLENLITIIVYLIVFVLLVVYARKLGLLWPQAYPRHANAAPAFTAFVFVGGLVALYFALQPVITAFSTVSNLLTWFQVFLLVLTVFLVVWASVVLYRFIPGWLSNIGVSVPRIPVKEMACLNCGRLNSSGSEKCSHCGMPLQNEMSVNNERICPSCKQEVPSEKENCSNCGTWLGVVEHKPEAEAPSES